MSQLTEDLDRLIQKAALDGALTQKAVDMFHTMLGENDELRESLEKKDRFERERNITMEKLEKDLAFAKDLNQVAAKAEMEMIERELKMTTLELTAKHEKQRVEDHQNMVGLIFRNTVLRNTVLGQELVALPGTPDEVDQYGNIRGGTGRPPEAIGVPVSKTEVKEET